MRVGYKPNQWVAHDERPPRNPCRSRLGPPIFGRCGRGTEAPPPARSFTAFAEEIRMQGSLMGKSDAST